MRLKNHIALRFLTDDNLALEMVETQLSVDGKKYGITTRKMIEEAGLPGIRTVWNLICKDNQKAYLVTETVLNKLCLLKVKKNGLGQYDWTVFRKLNPCKKTFILPPDKDFKGGSCLRLETLKKVAQAWRTGHTALCICKDLGLIEWRNGQAGLSDKGLLYLLSSAQQPEAPKTVKGECAQQAKKQVNLNYAAVGPLQHIKNLIPLLEYRHKVAMDYINGSDRGANYEETFITDLIEKVNENISSVLGL